MGLLVVGVLLVVGGMFGLRVAIGVTRQEMRLRGGVTVPGEVVGFNTRQRRHRERTVTYTFPVVRFRTREGVEHVQESQYSWSGRQGQQVPVRYSPDDPTLCRVATSKMGVVGVAASWLVTVAFTVVGVSLAVTGLNDMV